MSRISRLAVLAVALMSLFAVASSSAGAVTWHNTGNTHYTATGGPMTLSVGSSTISCASVDVTGTSFSGSITTNRLATITQTFTGCTALFLPAHMQCSMTFTGSAAHSTTTVTGTGEAHCVANITMLSPCTIGAFLPITATNAGASPGRLHVAHTTAVTISGCALSGTGTLSAQVWTITNGIGGGGSRGPHITRTA